MHLTEIQVNRKTCRSAGPAPYLLLHPTDNRKDSDMHLTEIQSANRKTCRGAGPAPYLLLRPTDNRKYVIS